MVGSQEMISKGPRGWGQREESQRVTDETLNSNTALTLTLAPNSRLTDSACKDLPGSHQGLTGEGLLIDILGTEEQCHCNSQANCCLRKWFSTQASFFPPQWSEMNNRILVLSL